MKKHKASKPPANIFMQVPVAQRPTSASQVERQIVMNLYAQGQHEQVLQFTQNLSQQYPNDAFAWKMMGASLRVLKRLDDSMAPLQNAAKLAPTDPEAFHNLGCTMQDLAQAEFAEACYRHALSLKPDFVDTLANLAEMMRAQGKTDEALALYQKKLAVQPDDDYTRHIVHTLSGEQAERATPDYVHKVFDFYADTFDQHLQEGLQYNAPEQLAALVSHHKQPAANSLDVLDLGCGTGLVGVAVAPLARQLVGVDLSPGMLDKARARQLYQRLDCADLIEMMRAEPASSYDLIVAADVFIYVGKIDEIVQQAKRLLRPGGCMAFSIETLEPAQGTSTEAHSTAAPLPDYRLEKTSRFTQSIAYVERLAQQQGFKALAMSQATIRKEGLTPVNGCLVLWQA